MFTDVYRKSGNGWAAYVEEVPGVNTQGETLEEARENLQEALAMVLDANREPARREESADLHPRKPAAAGVKRANLERHLRDHHAESLREGGKHSIWSNPGGSTLRAC